MTRYKLTKRTQIDSFSGSFRFLSNFYPHPVVEGGHEYPTNEHYFQAHKALLPADATRIRRAETPRKAKYIAKRIDMIPNWDVVRFDVMMEGLRLKFVPGEDLGLRLLATGSAFLIEGNDWGDQIWGQENGEGLNMLGACLMLRRAELCRVPAYARG